MRNAVSNFAIVLCFLLGVISTSAAPVVRQGSGASAATLRAIVGFPFGQLGDVPVQGAAQ
jgi:hypothetical protein